MAETVDLKQLIKNEYKKCAKSPAYFIRKYCFIQEPIKGRIPFDLYEYQEKAIDDFEAFQFTIILKGRQIGISTAVACYALWLMLFQENKEVLIIATKQDTAKTMIDKVKFAFDLLPVWLQSQLVENNKTSLKFKNKSKISASSASEDAGRSLALSLLILDEAAFIPKVDDIWTAAMPTLSTGGRAILISTPNGMGNFFHRKWNEAVTDRPDDVNPTISFHPIKLDWTVHPDRDKAWREKMGKAVGEQKAKQEFDADFLGSGANVFDAYKVNEWLKKAPDPLFKLVTNPDVRIWKQQELGRKYMVCADVARGDGSDYSAFHVIDLETSEQVVEYVGRVDTNAFADLLMMVAIQYNHALLVVERENVGWAVLQRIIDVGYGNLFYMSKDYKVVDVHRNIQNTYYAEEKKLLPGFSTNITTRPIIINKLDTYMREDAVKINSIRTLKEMEVFIWHNGKPQAQEGFNDDLIMSLGIGLWVRDTALMLHQQGIELTKMTLEKFQKTGYDGIYVPSQNIPDPYKLPTGDKLGTTIDLRWLF